MEEAIEKSILDITRQMKFMATKYDYHLNGNVADIMTKLKEKLQAAISFYTSVLKAYEELKNDHDALKKQISSFKNIFLTLVDKYQLASMLEAEEAVMSPENEENKELSKIGENDGDY